MHINDTGGWVVVWLYSGSPIRNPRLAHAFFVTKADALVFRDKHGGELYVKLADGSLKRAEA